MKIKKLLNITGRGNVLLTELTDKEIDDYFNLVGTKVRWDNIEYTIKRIEVSKPLMEGLPVPKEVGLVVDNPIIPNFEDGYYWTNKDGIIQITGTGCYSFGSSLSSCISNYNDDSVLDYKTIGEKIEKQ